MYYFKNLFVIFVIGYLETTVEQFVTDNFEKYFITAKLINEF